MRWQFPRGEGLVTNQETGEWSEAAFADEFLDESAAMPVRWHQAAPAPENQNVADWRRWAAALEKPGMAEHLLRVARSNAKHAVWRLEKLGRLRRQ